MTISTTTSAGNAFGAAVAVCLLAGCRGPSADFPDDPPADPSAVRVAVFVDCGARGPGAFRHLQIATFAKGVCGFPVDRFPWGFHGV